MIRDKLQCVIPDIYSVSGTYGRPLLSMLQGAEVPTFEYHCMITGCYIWSFPHLLEREEFEDEVEEEVDPEEEESVFRINMWEEGVCV